MTVLKTIENSVLRGVLSSILRGDRKLYFLLQSGQSLSLGATDASNTPIDTGELSNAHSFIDVPPTSLRDTPIVPSDIASLVPYKSTLTQQTHGYSMLRGLVSDIGGDWWFAPHGKGSSSVLDLSDGSVMFANGVAMLGALIDRAGELGLTPVIPFVDFIQGESGFTTEANDQVELRALQDSYITEAGLITGQTELPMILDQTGFAGGSNSAISRLRYTSENSDAYMACTKYILNRLFNSDAGDYTHLNTEGYIIQGEYHAICAAAVVNGEDFKPLQPLSFQVVGNTIEVTVEGATLPLVLDNTALPQCPAEGVVYTSIFDGILSPTVTVSGNKFIIDIGSIPDSRDTIVFGKSLDDSGTHPSGLQLPCGNIRDSQNIPSAVSGFTLQNWLVQFSYEMQKSDGTNPQVWRFEDPILGIIADPGASRIAGTASDLNPEFEIGQQYLVEFKHDGTGDFRYRLADKSNNFVGAGVETQESYTVTVSASNLRNEFQHRLLGFTGSIYDISVLLQ